MTNLEIINLEPFAVALDVSLMPQVIDLYLESRRNRVKQSTLRNYAENLRYFERWLAEYAPIRSWRLTRADFGEFKRWLSTVQNQKRNDGSVISYSTQNDALRRLKSVFRWGFSEEIFVRNYAPWVPERPAGAMPIRRPVELATLRDILIAADNTAYPLRNRAIVAVLAGSGLRRAECSALDVSDVQMFADKSGILSVQLGKGDKPRLAAFDCATGRILDAHMEQSAAGGPLFCSGHGCRLSPQGVYKAVCRCIDCAGVRDKIDAPCHDLRRLFARVWARERRGEGMGHLLSAQLGHTDYGMTAVYTQQQIDDVIEVFVSPVSMITPP